MHLVGSMVRTHKLLVKQFLGQFASTGLAILAGRPFQLRSKIVTVFFSLILLKHPAAIVDIVVHKLHLSNSTICGFATHGMRNPYSNSPSGNVYVKTIEGLGTI